MQTVLLIATNVALVAVAAGLTYLAIAVAMPLLERYALARPNARSSHSTPTAQGGGLAVLAAFLATAGLGMALAGPPAELGWGRLAMISTALLALAAVGAWDDIRPLPVLPRLVLQVIACAIILAALPASTRTLPMLPGPVELGVLLLGLVWFVNLTNFMDGIDGITVAELVPMFLALALLAHLRALPPEAGIMALAAAGALLGFAPWNRHVARLFLGDVGSLPLGALGGFLLIVLAGRGHLAAALLLPLYYLLDSTITLGRRIARGERLSQAHRSHAYQVATSRGYTVPQVTHSILRLNIGLVALALTSVLLRNTFADVALLLIGLAATLLLMRKLESGPR